MCSLVRDQSRVAPVDDVPEPTWDALRTQMSRSGISPSWSTAGLWALDTLEEMLGEAWVNEIWKRGELPPFIGLSWSHTQAMLELMEFALKLDVLRHVRGAASVRRECRTDLQRVRAAHTQLQLEVAALARDTTDLVALEARQASGYVADVEFAVNGAQVPVETFVVGVPEVDRLASAAFDTATDRLLMMGARHGFEISGEINTTDAMEVIEDLESFEFVLSFDTSGDAQEFHRPWGWVRAEPSNHGGIRSVRGGSQPTDLGAHLIRKVAAKAEQADGTGTVWLRADVHSGLWLLTPWSAESLETKTLQLGSLVHSALDHAEGIAGFVLSSGAGLALAHGEQEATAVSGGWTGVRRRLPTGRGRETIIVPLTTEAEPTAAAWQRMYSEEAEWLPRALARAGLPSLEEIFPTWAPVDLDP